MKWKESTQLFYKHFFTNIDAEAADYMILHIDDRKCIRCITIINNSFYVKEAISLLMLNARHLKRYDTFPENDRKECRS